MILHPHKKDDVLVAVLNMTRHPTIHLLKKTRGVPSKEPKELDPIFPDTPSKGKGIKL